MASLSEHSAASDSGNYEIGALFDVWAAMAVQVVLDPDEIGMVANLALLLRQLAKPEHSG